MFAAHVSKGDFMRLLIILLLLAFPVLLLSYSSFDEAAGAGRSTQGALRSTPTGLILQQSEGERRVRRTRPGSDATMAAPAMIIKVDGRNGGSSDLFVGYEEIAPGNSIPAHSHPEYDEVLFVQRGKGLATLGSQQRMVTTGATVYIPPKTRVSLKNTGTQTLSIFFVFPRPEMVSDYYREMTVAEGEPMVPFSPAEFAAFRARHRDHIAFDER
jgi:quercetin dioxygenase-like cupin family protein